MWDIGLKSTIHLYIRATSHLSQYCKVGVYVLQDTMWLEIHASLHIDWYFEGKKEKTILQIVGNKQNGVCKYDFA